MTVIVYNTHDIRVDHISNNYATGTPVKTENIPVVSVERTNRINAPNEALLILENDWLNADGKRFLARDLVSPLDIIQVWRDGVLDFSGRYIPKEDSDRIRLTKTTVEIPLFSHSKLLEGQITGVETYTEDPTTTAKRFLKGWVYSLGDDFNRADSDTVGGSFEEFGVEADFDIVSEKLKCMTPDTGVSAPLTSGVKSVASFSATDDIEGGFKLTLSDVADEMYFHYFNFVDANSYFCIQITRLSAGLSSVILLLEQDEFLQTPTPSLDYFYYPFSSGVEFSIRYSMKKTVLDANNDNYTVSVWLNDTLGGTWVFTLANTGTSLDSGEIRIMSKKENILTDDVYQKKHLQLITEGTMTAYGASSTTKVSYENYLSAITNRIIPFMASTDSLADTWEWREYPVAYDPANPTAPLGYIDLKERIGTNKAVTFSFENENIADISTGIREACVSEIIALGGGTTAMDTAGQLIARAQNIGVAGALGLSMSKLEQVSDESDLTRLNQLATLKVAEESRDHESVDIDPIDYEAKGLEVGDAYLIDVEEVSTDPAAYYRILTETRNYVGMSESVTVSCKDYAPSFQREARKKWRQDLNKARYDQGHYLTLNWTYQVEGGIQANTYDPNTWTTVNKDIKLQSGYHLFVHKVLWNFECDDPTDVYTVWIDAVDRTEDIFGTATIYGNHHVVDITAYMTEVTSHTIEIHNDSGVNGRAYAHWGEVEVYARS